MVVKEIVRRNLMMLMGKMIRVRRRIMLEGMR
jgi:hypothetical protein